MTDLDRALKELGLVDPIPGTHQYVVKAEIDRLRSLIDKFTKPYTPNYPEPKIYEHEGQSPQVWFRDVNRPNI